MVVERKRGEISYMNNTPDPQNDPLQELLADDAQSIDRNRLATFLKPFVRFDKASKEPHFLVGYESIVSNDAKIEVVLLASKARSLIFGEPEGLSPVEIIKLDIMPEGSVKSSIKKLSDGRKIKKDATGKYSVPNYRINDITERVRAKE